MTVHQIVTMASIIQREAALLSEMPQISAVFWNRLKPQYAPTFGGGLLGADATVQYAIGYDATEGTWWKRNLTVTDLAIKARIIPASRRACRRAPSPPPALPPSLRQPNLMNHRRICSLSRVANSTVRISSRRRSKSFALMKRSGWRANRIDPNGRNYLDR